MKRATLVAMSGGREIVVSPTIASSTPMRFFTYVYIPLAQNYAAVYQVDPWRAGIAHPPAQP